MSVTREHLRDPITGNSGNVTGWCWLANVIRIVDYDNYPWWVSLMRTTWQMQWKLFVNVCYPSIILIEHETNEKLVLKVFILTYKVDSGRENVI